MKNVESPLTVIFGVLLLLAPGCSPSANLNEGSASRGQKQPEAAVETRKLAPSSPVLQGPSSAELSTIDDLARRHKYESARQEINRLQKKYPTSSEVYYKGIKLLVLEVKWALTLPPGEERTVVMKKASYSEDYLGLICSGTSAYIDIFGPNDKHFNTMKALRDIARAALRDAHCRQRPVTESGRLDVPEFIARLGPFADFVKKLESMSIE